MSKLNSLKIDIWIFVISIFLQAFSIIKTDSFGISFVTTVVVYLTLKYRLFTSIKQNRSFLLFNLLIIALLLFTYFINRKAIDILKICRLEIVICTTYFSIVFLNLIRRKEYLIDFYKIVNKITVLICIYGIYQYIAYFFRLPLFLNVFSNNPSYGGDFGLYSYYGGWQQNRIYTTFSEPSFYGQFLVILFFVIYIIRKNYDKIVLNTNLSIVLILINLYLTGARSAQVQFIYVVVGLIGWHLLDKRNLEKLQKIYYYLFISLPLINLAIMKFADDHVFNDLSSKARTYSGLYYLQESFTSIKYALFGHGLGVMQREYELISDMQYIEAYAHNGYVEIIYECGIILFLLILIYIIMLLSKIDNKMYRFIVLAVIVNSNDFATGYNIESIIVLLGLIGYIALSFNNNLDFEKGEQNEVLYSSSKL